MALQRDPETELLAIVQEIRRQAASRRSSPTESDLANVLDGWGDRIEDIVASLTTRRDIATLLSPPLSKREDDAPLRLVLVPPPGGVLW